MTLGRGRDQAAASRVEPIGHKLVTPVDEGATVISPSSVRQETSTTTASIIPQPPPPPIVPPIPSQSSQTSGKSKTTSTTTKQLCMSRI